MNIKLDTNGTVQLPIGGKYVAEDVYLTVEVPIPNTTTTFNSMKYLFKDTIDVSTDFEYECYFSPIGWPEGSKIKCESGVLSIYNETHGWISIYSSSGFTEAVCQGINLKGEYPLELIQWLINNGYFDIEYYSEKYITENGVHNVFGYHKATVGVPNYLKSFIEGTMVNPTIPSGTTSIRAGAFHSYPNITDVVIPNTVTEIGSSAFQSSSITSIVFPEGITNIPQACCGNCSNLANVSIPNTVTEIYAGAFQQCNSLVEIFIPSSVTKLYRNVFVHDSSLKTLDLSEHTTVPTLLDTNFPSSLTKIKVKSSMVSAFKAATNWSTYANIISSS